MITLMADVIKFMEIGHPERLAESLRIPTLETVVLVRKLIDEEVNQELLASIEKGDIVEIADAIGDAIYVLVFAALCYGLPLDKVWKEIAKTNLAKFPGGQVLRDPVTQKVLKPPGWVPPMIKQILRDQIPSESIFCPRCGKRHTDEGAWATTIHRKHKCVNDINGRGCDLVFLYPADHFAFGIAPVQIG